MSKELFTERLNYMMEKRKLTITDLARKSGIDKGTINAYQKGRYKAKAENIKKLADALNVDDIWLMGLDDQTAFEMAAKRAEKNISNFLKGMHLCGFNEDEIDAFLEYKELHEDRKKLIRDTIHMMHETQGDS